MNNDQSLPSLPTLLYLSGTLPARSETFVYRELLGLRQRGWSIMTASVHEPERDLGTDDLDALAETTFALYPRGAFRVLSNAVLEAIRRPKELLASMRRLWSDLTGQDVGSAPLRRAKIIWQFVVAMGLARWARRRGIEHIHVHMAHVPTTIGMYAAQHLGIPFSFTGHAVDLFRERTLLKEKLHRAAFVNCISDWHRAFYRQYHDRPDHEYPVVRCGVDPDEFCAGDRTSGSLVEFLAVGRLVRKKGFDVLLDALAQCSNSESIRLHLVGDGPEAGALAAQAERLGLTSRVMFYGARDNREVRELMKACDLFVLPCRVDERGDRDGIPVVLMEAMASEVAVMTGDLPAIRELVRHNETGWLVEPGAVESLVEALNRLVDDPGKRADLAAGGRARIIEEFALDVNVGRLHNALTAAHGWHDMSTAADCAPSDDHAKCIHPESEPAPTAAA